MPKTFLLGFFLMVFSQVPAVDILTLGTPQAFVLTTKTEAIQKEEFLLAQQIADQLYHSLAPFFPAAGLAAPQIGIGKSIFIFSPDRDPNNLEVVINPSFEPLTQEKIEGWEGCLSGVWQCAKIPRYASIHVSYLTLKGEKVDKDLHGFAAKVFQHEYDHLQGVVNVLRPDAEIKQFENRHDFTLFMQKVKKDDEARYTTSR